MLSSYFFYYNVAGIRSVFFFISSISVIHQSVRLLIPYSQTASAKAFISIHPEDAVLSFDPIVPAILFSDARAAHTAFASHSGESSVNGLIDPVINPSAEMSASAERVTKDSPVENATAPRVPVAVKDI